jgi:uncharacterized protein (TIGR02145 family)
MANIISATIFGANGNDWNQPSGVEMGFPTKNVVFKGIPPTNYSGNICNSQIQLLPTAPSTIQPVYYTNEFVDDLINASNSPSGYPFVTICDQDWMDKNWDGTTFRNGDVIPEVTDQSAWAALTTPAWCYYDNDPANGAIYGKLYNWYAVSDPRGLAPVGWRVPTENDYNNFITCLGGDFLTVGGKMKETGTVNWDSPNTGATNESGFTLLGAGNRDEITGNFNELKTGTYLWTESSSGVTNGKCGFADSSSTIFDFPQDYDKNFGFSVRLLKDI